jgi:hypothetical protein
MNSIHSTIEPMIDEHEVARVQNRSVSSVRRDRLLRKGCPYLKIGSLVRYKPSELRAFLDRIGAVQGN